MGGSGGLHLFLFGKVNYPMKRKVKNNISIVLFLLPALLFFVGILIVPIVSSVYNSMFHFTNLAKTDLEFVGFENYVKLFTEGWINFGLALKNVFILAAVSVFLQLPLSLGLALMLGKGIKLERLFLSVYFMPVLISALVIGMLWDRIYEPQGGVFVYLMGLIGAADSLPPEGVLGNEKTALIAVLIPVLWQYVGYHMLLMYAGVKSVSPELREAAKLDGATDWQVDKYVVIPSIKQIIKVSVIFAVTGSFKTYDLLKAFSKGRSSFAYNVPTIILSNTVTNNGGIASSIAVILIIMCFAFAIIINKIFKERDPYGKK